MENPYESIDDVTRPSLLRRVRDPQDGEAWTVFLEIYGPLVYGYCRRSLLQESDAADVSQEVMMRVSQALRRFEYDPARGSFRHWLGRITRNEVARFFRMKGRKPERPAGTEGPAVELDGVAGEDVWDEHFHSALLEAAIQRIEPMFESQTWSAFQAVWVDDMPAEAASRHLGLPVEKIYVAKSRVLKRLREELLLLCEDIPNANRK